MEPQRLVRPQLTTQPIVHGLRFSYGTTFRSKTNQMAWLKSTSALITGPPDALDYIVAATGASYNFRLDAFVRSCKGIDALPDMVFNLSGFEYRLPARDYIRQVCGRGNAFSSVFPPPSRGPPANP